MKRKHDHSTGFGLTCGVLVIISSIIWGREDIWGTLLKFYDVPSIFIVICGSTCAIFVSFQWDTVKSIPSILKNSFLMKELKKKELIGVFTDLAKKARKDGLLTLEKDLDKIHDRFLRSGMQMVIDGYDIEKIKDIKMLEIDKTVERHKKAIQVFRMWANLAPSFGMMGTFSGLILMMENFQDMSKFSSAFATVLVTSFYGVILANLVFGPLANKLDIKNSEEVNRMEMIIEGIVGISAGSNPRVLEDNLKVFLSPSERLEMEVVSIKKAKDKKKKESEDVA